ncbi:hypothetical protein TNCT_79531 [Trichonephila clavata]|uniref:Uncharacterized protein n=1 Tax=Trichonephila clavata TaxID=2740835 RepID=A0A8X6FGF0_TRICU|nr:hypothetical protein TNCT_79531 [Trichonephila clavata]
MCCTLRGEGRCKAIRGNSSNRTAGQRSPALHLNSFSMESVSPHQTLPFSSALQASSAKTGTEGSPLTTYSSLEHHGPLKEELIPPEGRKKRSVKVHIFQNEWELDALIISAQKNARREAVKGPFWGYCCLLTLGRSVEVVSNGPARL